MPSIMTAVNTNKLKLSHAAQMFKLQRKTKSRWNGSV